MVTLTMVPDRFECCATAHFTVFKQREKVLAKCGTQTCVLRMAFFFRGFGSGLENLKTFPQVYEGSTSF